MSDSYPALFRLFLVCAVFTAITGACFANQYVIMEYAQGKVFTVLSVVLWAIHGIAAVVVSYMVTSSGLEARLRWVLRTILPAVLVAWLLVWAIFGTRAVSETFFIPAILAVLAALLAWRTSRSSTAATASVLVFACGGAAFAIPVAARWLMALVALVFFVLAAFCYSQSRANWDQSPAHHRRNTD